MCEYCNKEFIKTYISKHNEKCLIKKLPSNNCNENMINNIIENNTGSTEGTGGTSRALRA